MRVIAVFCMAALPVLCIGCDSAPHPTVPVTGVATFEGEPVKGASIDFVPQEGTRGRPATAITDESGAFEMSTYSRGDGVVPGTHKVTVTLTNPDAKMVVAGMPSESSIPIRYTRPQTTPFEFEIQEGEEAKHLELEMTKESQQ